jgi:hypothetical protein
MARDIGSARPTATRFRRTGDRGCDASPGASRGRPGPGVGSMSLELAAVEDLRGRALRRRANARLRGSAWAARWRSIAVTATRQEAPRQAVAAPIVDAAVKGPPIGPRTANSSARRSGETKSSRHRSAPPSTPRRRRRRNRMANARPDSRARLCGEPNVDVLAGNMARTPGTSKTMVLARALSSMRRLRLRLATLSPLEPHPPPSDARLVASRVVAFPRHSEVDRRSAVIGPQLAVNQRHVRGALTPELAARLMDRGRRDREDEPRSSGHSDEHRPVSSTAKMAGRRRPPGDAGWAQRAGCCEAMGAAGTRSD